MRNGKFKKLPSLVIATAMSVVMLATSIKSVSAGDTWPYEGDAAKGKNQPRVMGQRVYDLENWSPETEPYADLMRAQIPLQERNKVFAATQANPNLKSEAEIFNMQGDYGNSFFEATTTNNEFSQYLFNYWQYTDYYASWHGVTTKGAPSSVYDPNGAWQERYFEFGLVNMPNPAYTNAAHKNGSKSIGCIFLPRAGQTHASMIKKDANGEFPIAKKLIEFAKYYGFDGYFINQEESIPAGDVPIYKEFTKYMIANGMYIQWYDSITPTGGLSYQNQLNATNSPFIKDEVLGKVNNSLFVNYDWFRSNRVETSLAHATERGINPFTEVFFGVEAAQNKLSGGHGSGKGVPLLYEPGTKNLRASLALFTPSDFIQNGLDGDMSGSDAPNTRAKDEYQWMIAERERMYYSGVLSDPTNTGLKPGTSRPEVGTKDTSGWVGVADFTSERSVVNGTTFATDFNTGHGLDYMVKGKISNSEEWSNMNIQDILPTWQWWVDVPQKSNPNATQQNPDAKIDAGSKLKVDFDYGKEYKTGTFDYEKVGAYNGGSSLVVTGKLDVENFLRLYKTNLDVKKTSKINITFNKTTKSDGSEMKVGLIFEDAPNKVVYVNVPNSGKKTKGWVNKQLNLSKFAGKKIAAMGLAFDAKKGTVDNYQINIGEIKITDGKRLTPSTPTGFKIDKAYDTTEMKVTWDIADYSKVKQYNIYAKLSNGDKVFLGGTYGNAYYIKSLYNEKGIVSLDLTAVGADKSESKPATVAYDFSSKVREIKVAEAKTPSGNFVESANAGFLDVSWLNPKNNTSKINLEVTLNYSSKKEVYTKTVESNVTSTQIQVPIADGSNYTLAIATVKSHGIKNASVNYTGKLKDVYIAPYTDAVKFTGKSVTFEIPRTEDWWHMYATYNGKPLIFRSEYDTSKQFAIRGKSFIHNVPLPTANGVLTVVMEDYSGNKSQPIDIPYSEGGSQVGIAVDSAMFPGAALLAAVKEQAQRKDK